MLNTDPWYISSTGEGLALRIKGALLALIPLILIALKYYHIEIGNGELNAFADLVEKLVTDIFAVISGTMLIYGQLRAWYLKFKN